MFGKAKKTVSLAYKEKLLAEIAHYEKRIEEALNRRKQNSFADGSFEEDITNPYKLKIQPSQYELKQQEASLSDRVSMTLDLAMLTILQSEVNVMVTPPVVRKPVVEDGVWYEVEAECKIDLVSFAITFYAHKPHRKFAPTRYRNVAILMKPAHEKELAQSILPKLHLPNLALQVLQSYATAFRSRRTTLLELAEKYADKLRMRDMPEGGYRVTFLDLLQVDWTLENLWSPIVPFCHRMKFEVEYMPKDYIQAIGKLYKQFKDPSLNTSERTLTLSKIFDICLQAAGPARELQESFESDPETTGRLHERRTTIDQEPEVPQVEQSPKRKEPTGKENKPQNRKTSMAPPKTIPKKAKKSKPNEKDINENRKSVKRAIESDSSNVIKKSKVDDNDNSKKAGLKGGREGTDKDNETEDVAAKDVTGKDSTARKDTGKDGTAKNGIGKDSTARKYTGKDGTAKNDTGKEFSARKDTGKDGTAKNDTGKDATSKKDIGKDATAKKGTGKDAANNREAERVSLESNVPKKSGKVNAKKAKDTDSADTAIPENDVMKKRDGKTVKSKGSGNTEDGIINNAKKNKEVGSSKSSEASSKGSKKGDAKTNDKIAKSKEKPENNVAILNGTEDVANAKNAKTTDKNYVKTLHANTESNVAKSKKVTDNLVDILNDKPTGKDTDKSKDTEEEKATKKDAESIVNKKKAKKASAKKDERSVASSKQGTKKAENEVAVPKSKATNKVDGKNVDNTKGCNTENKTNANNVNDTDTVIRTSSKTVASKDGDGKIEAASNLKDTNKVDTLLKKAAKNTEKEANLGKTREGNEKTKTDVKKPTQKDINAAKPKEVGTSNVCNKHSNDILTENKEKDVKQTGKVVQKNKVIQDKLTDTVKEDMNKEKGLAEKRKFTNPKSNEQTSDLDRNKITVDKTSKTNIVRDVHRTDKNDLLAKKIKTTEPHPKNIINNNGNPKRSTTNNKEKPNNTKALNASRILKENTHREENEKKIEKNPTKNQKNNMLNVTITKSKIIPLSKLQTDTQIKIADKLKTKIPMMKSKMTFSSLGDKLKMNNLGRISKGVEKTKIPQKSLPVFKKVSKNVPTRISPRKLLTAKPSSHGFSNK